MKKIITILAAGFFTSAMSMLATAPAAAASVDINIGVPTVVTQARPVYVLPQYELDWRERQARAAAWRNNPVSHPAVDTPEIHSHVVHKKSMHKKRHQKHHGKHPDKHDD
jgi:hypothetical protein